MLPYSLQTAHVTIVKVGSILDFEPVVTTSKGKSILDLAMESSELETLQRRLPCARWRILCITNLKAYK